MSRGNFLKWGFRVIVILVAAFYYQRHIQVESLVDTKYAQQFKVVDKKCRNRRGGSYVDIEYKGAIHRVEFYGKKCFKAEIGGTVVLYYDSKNKFFYVPESRIYERYIYGAIVILLLSFVPWEEVNRKLNSIGKVVTLL